MPRKGAAERGAEGGARRGVQALIRRKVKAVDRGALLHIKVPLPLPLAWGRTVAPYAPPGEARAAAPGPAQGDENVDGNADPAARAAAMDAVRVEADDVLSADWGRLRTRFQARPRRRAAAARRLRLARPHRAL